MPRFSTDSLDALRSVILSGIGLSIVSAWRVAEGLASGDLVQLAPAWRAEVLPVSQVYSYARFYPARLRRFAEIIKAGAAEIFGDLADPALR